MMDFSDNVITEVIACSSLSINKQLENFPILKRLNCLLISNNYVKAIDSKLGMLQCAAMRLMTRKSAAGSCYYYFDQQ